MLGEDDADEVGDDDLVAGLIAVGDEEDLLERAVDVDLVEDPLEADGARGRDGPDVCVRR